MRWDFGTLAASCPHGTVAKRDLVRLRSVRFHTRVVTLTLWEAMERGSVACAFETFLDLTVGFSVRLLRRRLPFLFLRQCSRRFKFKNTQDAPLMFDMDLYQKGGQL